MQNKNYQQQPIYRSRRHKKKKSNFWPIFLLIVAFIIAAVAGAFFASSSLFNKPQKATKENLMIAKDKVIVMIMGVDEREGDVGRSDTLMVATLDPKKKKAAILSIPRDTRVKIRGNGFDKINAAYAYGGYHLTKDTVENLLGVEMEHYVLINVKSFKKIIDAIGGVEINVEKRMYYEDVWDDDGGLLINLYPGMQHMDGNTAITYVRYRDEEGDIGRIARQQKFMQAVMDKITSPAIIPRIPTIVKEVIGSIQTDLSMKELIEFLTTLKEAQRYGLQSEMLPGKPMYIDGISYWIPDLSKLRTTIANTLDVPMSNNIRNTIERDAMEYRESIPDNAVELKPEETRRLNRIEREGDERKSSKKNTKLPSTDSSLLKDPYDDDKSTSSNSTNSSDSYPSTSRDASEGRDSTPSIPDRSSAPSPGVPSAGKTAQ